MRKIRGFTLIELLVVIAILALLLSILIPAFKKAKVHAAQIVCMNNLRQLGIGMHMYTTNNNGKTMKLLHDGDNYWFHEIAPYLGDWDYKEHPEKNLQGVMKIVFCPMSKRPLDNPLPNQTWYGSSKTSWRMFNTEGGYGLNCWFSPEGVYEGEFPSEYCWDNYSESTFSDVPVFGDSVWVGHGRTATIKCRRILKEKGIRVFRIRWVFLWGDFVLTGIIAPLISVLLTVTVNACN